jgi:hypothetical protein
MRPSKRGDVTSARSDANRSEYASLGTPGALSLHRGEKLVARAVRAAAREVVARLRKGTSHALLVERLLRRVGKHLLENLRGDEDVLAVPVLRDVYRLGVGNSLYLALPVFQRDRREDGWHEDLFTDAIADQIQSTSGDNPWMPPTRLIYVKRDRP